MRLSGSVYSRIMDMDTGLTIVMPNKLREGRYKVVYLLHGLCGNDRSWLDYSMLPAYAAKGDTVYVMPDAGRSFYSNMKYGFDYQRYVTEELPVICRNMFNISAAREDTGIMGCSMGGYGALRCALTHPDSYGFVGAFSSGPLFAKAGMDEIKKYGDLPDYAERFGLRLIKDFKAIYGESLELTDDAEILDMLLKVKAENKLPRIYLTCGKDDAFMKEHELFTGALDKMGIPYEFDKLEGAHEFQCFNEALKRAIARFEGR